MTKKEAIKWLDNCKNYLTAGNPIWDTDKVAEAFDYAISALEQDVPDTNVGDMISRKALCEYALNQKDKSITPNDIMRFPSAQPEPCQDTISRQAAIDDVTEYEKLLRKILGDKNELAETVKIVKHRIIALPSIQPDIIRCRDCRFNTYSKKCLNPDSFFLVPADDFYCGYAERRIDGVDS